MPVPQIPNKDDGFCLSSLNLTKTGRMPIPQTPNKFLKPAKAGFACVAATDRRH